jgi:hypothetical protein
MANFLSIGWSVETGMSEAVCDDVRFAQLLLVRCITAPGISV